MGGVDRLRPLVSGVLAVMNTRRLADLLHTNEQIIRQWVRDGSLPAHRQAGGRKLSFLRHEIFEWLNSNRYHVDRAEKD